MTAPLPTPPRDDDGLGEALVKVERALEQAMGCRKGQEQQELDADLRPASPVYATCESNAHDHAYYDRYCGFANNLAAIVGVVLSDARLVAAARADELRAAADDIQALHPGEVKNSVIWLRDRAARIARSTPQPNEREEPENGHDSVRRHP
jgi:hypothetical protein